jgi:hypothetical protein
MVGGISGVGGRPLIMAMPAFIPFGSVQQDPASENAYGFYANIDPSEPGVQNNKLMHNITPSTVTLRMAQLATGNSKLTYEEAVKIQLTPESYRTILASLKNPKCGSYAEKQIDQGLGFIKKEVTVKLNINGVEEDGVLLKGEVTYQNGKIISIDGLPTTAVGLAEIVVKQMSPDPAAGITYERFTGTSQLARK